MASRFFWATIFVLAFATLTVTAVSSYRQFDTPSIPPVESKLTTLERLLSDAAIAATKAVEPEIDTLLDTVYGPAYKAIPAYADFHYSVLGEYIELTEAATGKMSAVLYDRLFDGFEDRLKRAASSLDQRYVEEYQSNLKEQVANHTARNGNTLPLGEITDAVVEDAVTRARTTLPLATVAVGAVGSGSLKVVSATIAKKLAAKIAAKASAKGVAKGGAALTGAGGGALLCSWSGPGAVVCGIVGGAAAWFLTDALVINLDEYFNREDFEAELRSILDEDRAEKRDLLVTILEEKAVSMDAASEEIFRLRDLSSER